MFSVEEARAANVCRICEESFTLKDTVMELGVDFAHVSCLEAYKKISDERLDKEFNQFLAVIHKKVPGEFAKILVSLKEIHSSKQSDYNSSGIQFRDYIPDGLRTLHSVIRGKVVRLKSLIGDEGYVVKAKHEPTSDSATDLAVYALLMAAVAKVLEEH